MKTFLTLLWLFVRLGGRLVWWIALKLLGLAFRPFRPLLGAVRYLTILPLPRRLAGGAEELARAPVAFPVAGLVLGLLAGGLSWCLPHLFQDWSAAAVVVVLLVVLSRGMTLAGLARTADRALAVDPAEIPRPPGGAPAGVIGAMGATAIGCVLLLKFAALVNMDSLLRWRYVVLVPLAGRCAMVVAMAVLRVPADPDRPQRVWFRRGSTLNAVLCAVWAALALLAVAWWVQAGLPNLRCLGQWETWTRAEWWLAGLQGAIAAAVSLLVALGGAWFLRRRKGGDRVEALGAVCELAEVALVLFLAAHEIRGFFTGPLYEPPPSADQESLWFVSALRQQLGVA